MPVFAMSSKNLHFVNVPRQKFIIFAINVDEIFPFNILQSKLCYSNPFHNATVPNESWFTNFAQNWLPWQCPFRNRKKRSRSSSTNKYLPFGEKIDPVDPDIIGLQEINKK